MRVQYSEVYSGDSVYGNPTWGEVIMLCHRCHESSNSVGHSTDGNRKSKAYALLGLPRLMWSGAFIEMSSDCKDEKFTWDMWLSRRKGLLPYTKFQKLQWTLKSKPQHTCTTCLQHFPYNLRQIMFSLRLPRRVSIHYGGRCTLLYAQQYPLGGPCHAATLQYNPPISVRFVF